MFLKRLAAIVITLLLIAQLTACNKESNSIPSNSSQQAINSQTTSKEDGFSQNNSQTGAPSADNSQQDSDRDQTSSDNNQNTDNSGQNGNKPPVISCNHSSDPYQNISKTEFYANYKTACCNLDASYRSKHGFLSGSLGCPVSMLRKAKADL